MATATWCISHSPWNAPSRVGCRNDRHSAGGSAGTRPDFHHAAPSDRACPVTATSYPFLAAHRLQEPIDLAKIGYVEEEFFVSGRANVYDWAADGS